MKARKMIILYILFAVWAGCERQQEQKSDEGYILRKEICDLDLYMETSGNIAYLKGEYLVRKICTLPDAERNQFAKRYVRKLEALGTIKLTPGKEVIRLYNYQNLLKSIDLLDDTLQDDAKLVDLYILGVDLYSDAIAKRSRRTKTDMKDEIRRAQELRVLIADADSFFSDIRKVYLPLVIKKRFSQVQFEKLRMGLEQKMQRVENEMSQINTLIHR